MPLLIFQAMDGLEFGVVVIDAGAPERVVVYANSAFERITGFSLADDLGKGCRLLAHEGADRSAMERLQQAMTAKEPCRIEFNFRKPDGSQGWILFSLSPIRNAEGEATHLIGLAQDITEARNARARLEQSESRLRGIMMSVEEGIQLWNTDGRLVYANPASSRLFGVVESDIAWDSGQQFFRVDGTPVHADDMPQHRVFETGQPENDTILRTVRPNGDSRWIRMHAQPILDPVSGALLGAVTSTADMTRNMEQEQHLVRLAHYDALTQLPNRVLLADRMQQVVSRAQRSNESFALGMMDLDGFKPINDTYGHKAGDQILREVGERLTMCIREGDTVARIGGDEFALLLTGFSTMIDCERILQRILTAISAPYMVSGEVVRLSTSIGVTLYPADLSDPDKLLRHADQAMYQAKQDGKGRFKFFDSALERRLRANQGTLQKIGEALAQRQFELYYQPVVDCRNGRVTGAEALVRWRHPVLGLLAPSEFLPLIEQDDLIVELGNWTLAEVLAQIEDWRSRGVDLDVSVNISARQLHQHRFSAQLKQVLETADPATARRLGIEIVETTALEDLNVVSDLIGDLREAGVRIALDDFGTGYSSLVHLRRLPVDSLKIDLSFVRDMLDDPLDLAIVEGVIGLAHAFQCHAVAEGVESIDHILMLLEMGCDRMQGFAIARPMSAAALFDWVESFKPDPLWRLATTPRPNRGDFHLMLAEANHRHWVDRVIACSQDDHLGMPAMDYRQCRFGQWYYGEGMRRYGNRKEFLALGGLHREIHELGERLCALQPTDAPEVRADLMAKLNESREKLVDSLKQIRWSWQDTSVLMDRTGSNNKEQAR